MAKRITRILILAIMPAVAALLGCRVITDTADIVARVIGIDNGVIFYGYDNLTPPQETVELAVRLQTKYLFDVENVAVGFYNGDEQLGIAITNDDGLAKINWTPSGPGDYNLEARIVAIPEYVASRTMDVSPIPLLVSVKPTTTNFVVIDLDRTLVGSDFKSVLTGQATPMPDSQHVTHRIAENYSIIYLTHRPGVLTHASKTWLNENGYPQAPLFVSELSQAIGSSGEFKTAALSDLRQRFPNINIGIGDKLSDAQAYVDNDLTAYLIPFYDPNNAGDVEDMAQDLSQLQGHGKLNVVSGWTQVEQGIFGNNQFPPQNFIQGLNQRYNYLRQQ